MTTILTALTTGTDDLRQTYRIRRLTVGLALTAGLTAAVALLPWGWLPVASIDRPTPTCQYDFDQTGQLWHTTGCDINEIQP